MKRLVLLLWLLAPLLAQAQLHWRISIKVFTGPGNVQPRLPYWSLGGTNLFQELSNGVGQANAVLASAARGYTWRLEEIVTLPGTTAPLPTETNSWFNLPVTPTTQPDIDAKARAHPVEFHYRDDAINIYYVDNTNSPNGGACTYPVDGRRVVIIAPNSPSNTLAHEVGHFFGLLHTFENQQYRNPDDSPCPAQACYCDHFVGGDDNTAETAPDHSCWTTRNELAVGVYSLPYFSLNSDQQWRVDNAWFNVMAYHPEGNRLTDDQMDFMTDGSNRYRLYVASGQTRFVDRTHTGSQDGSRANPFQTLGQGVDNAADGDIVLIRPGNYNEPGNYTKAVTLRATRGSARIGL